MMLHSLHMVLKSAPIFVKAHVQTVYTQAYLYLVRFLS